MSIIPLTLVAVLAVIALPAAQSLREQAQMREDGKASKSIEAIMPPLKPAEMLKRSDVVLYARVVNSRVRLSDDESLVVTEYDLLPLRVIKQSSAVSKSDTPASLPRLVVRRTGGTVTEGRYQYSTVDDNFPEDALRSGDEAVMFLLYSPEKHVFNFTVGPYAVYPVTDGRVRAATKEAAAIRRDGPPVELSVFLSRLDQNTIKQP